MAGRRRYQLLVLGILGNHDPPQAVNRRTRRGNDHLGARYADVPAPRTAALASGHPVLADNRISLGGCFIRKCQQMVDHVVKLCKLALAIRVVGQSAMRSTKPYQGAAPNEDPR